ncbi:MAG: PBP1A family penicillin-binding protein [Clostridiales bacterium]|nr:PBP1A family penicillin-binding protein [Clostridiales bacterium]
MVLQITGWATILFLLLASGLAVAASRTPLPPVDLPEASRLYDRHGRLIGSWFEENRTPVSSSQIPPLLKAAVVLMEDERFYEHHGVDPFGIARALYRNLRAGKVVEGGSTITAQLAKNLYLSPERTLSRKIKELLLTLKLEQQFSKDQILTLYLNTIYFGDAAYGVETASEYYFGKSVSELTLPEIALLAGMPRSPAAYSPRTHPDRAKARRDLVLDRMAQKGLITPKERDQAKAQPIQVARLAQPLPRSGYLMDYIRSEIATRYPEIAARLSRGGYRIFTTIDLDVQEAAAAALERLPVAGETAAGVRQPQGAILAVDPRTGEILAYVGGRNYQESPFDRVRDAQRQPGSAFKPFVYVTALAQRFPMTATQIDEPVSFPGKTPDAPPFVPMNFDRTFSYQPVDMTTALARSLNVVTARWMAVVGPDAVARTAALMGIESPLERSIPLALGTSAVNLKELVRAYTPLANLGWRAELFAVRRVEDARGRVLVPEGTFGPRATRVLEPGVAYITTAMLQSVFYPGGTAYGLGLGVPVAGKTGTTDEDAWFLGYTPTLLTGVWVGWDDYRPLQGQGATLAGPIWRQVMLAGLEAQGYPRDDWAMPSDVVAVGNALYLKGTEPEVGPWNWGAVPSPEPSPAPPPEGESPGTSETPTPPSSPPPSP